MPGSVERGGWNWARTRALAAHLVAPAALAASLLFGLFVGWREYNAASALDAAAMDYEIQIRMGALEDRLATREMMVRAVGATFVPPPALQAGGLSKVDPRLLRQAGDVYSFVWLPRVTPEQQAQAVRIASLVSGEQRDLFAAGFRPLTPQERAQTLYPVLDVLPKSAANLRSLGLNPMRMPGPEEAMTRAVAARDVAATAPMTLVQLPGEPAVVAYVPVGQLREPEGFIGFSFRVRSLVAPVLADGAQRMPVVIRDAQAGTLLHADQVPAGAAPLAERRARFGGRTWILGFHAPDGDAGAPLRQALVAGVTAALLSGLLLGGLLVMWRQNRRLAEAIAACDATEARMEVVAQELTHRIRNLFALAQALAQQSFRTVPEAAPALEVYSARLGAMADASDLLAAERPATMADVATAVRHTSGRVEAAGPPLALAREATQSLVLLVHELATNALKHGALSQPEGRVRLSWAVEDDRFRLDWEETDGPPVTAAPERRGFGRKLLEQILPRQMDGSAEIEFRAEGVRYRLDVPLDAIS